ncbi:MAG: hypothetical protein CMG63_00375 [Candidatus Marinimicrobia bacterium]|nr:hypothetical protein [Candidatus Neomarinimicrobiota bacterium]
MLLKRQFFLNKFILLLIISFVFSRGIKETSLLPSHITFANTKFDIVSNGNSHNRYIWLHGDEQTAKMALEYHIKKYSGVAFFIDSETREVPFESTIIDPNRIFSRKGSYYALRKFKPDWAPGTLKKALDKLDADREYFLNVLMPNESGYLISLHNNFRGYNVHKEKRNSQKFSIKKNQNPRDFILCTNAIDYEKLSSGPYNVVLQNQLPKKDDGSLSWEALRRNVRYLNVETRLGYLSKQKKMMKFIEKVLQ